MAGGGRNALDPSRVTVATVVDDRAPFIDEVAHLFESLELFGGAMRSARRRACFVNGVSAETERRMRELGVEARAVDEVEPRFRFANKLAMLAVAADEETDLLVALDSDVVVAGDFSDHLDPGLLQAKQPDGDLLTIAMWTELFEHFGFALPTERHPTSLRPGWTHAYFNAGVLMVPGAFLRPLHDRWLHFIRAQIEKPPVIRRLGERLRDEVPEYEGATSDDLEGLVFAEQWGLSLARHELGIPYAVLPLALNFPTIYEEDQRPGEYIRERFMPHAVTPLLVHHHHEIDGGFRPTGYAQPDAVLARVGEALFGARR